MITRRINAGIKGALSTAEALEGAGIETRLIILPKPEGIDKIDIADYMKEHSRDDFKKLMDSSSRLWTYKLNQQVINPEADSLERLRAFQFFISDGLHGMASGEWEIFVNNEVAKTYGFTKTDIKKTVAEISKIRSVKQTNDEHQAEEMTPGENTGNTLPPT